MSSEVLPIAATRRRAPLYSRLRPCLAALGVAAMAGAWAQSAPEIRCDGIQVCREQQTGLPLRVLPRPFSPLYGAKSEDPEGVLQASVRAFFPLYVFARDDLDLSRANDPQGWYAVGPSVSDGPKGWMRAKDVLEWRQALIVSYTHPGEGDDARGRVLMFEDLEQLRAMVESPRRGEQFAAAYEDLRAERIPQGVVSKEPQRFVDITERFYMLPVVDFRGVSIAGDDARYLRLAAAMPGQRGDEDVLTNPEFRARAGGGTTALMDLGAVAELVVDLVFVMDMTGSMQPYLDRTKDAIAEIATGSASSVGAGERIRFGLVGYRDHTGVVPGLEFVSRNFTPELVDAKRLVEILEREASAAKVGAGDYAEEVFAGIQTALASGWREKSLRLVVLIGDASSHPVGHEQNTTGLDAKTLRLMADDAKVHVLALHLQDERAASDHPLALDQFATLSRVRGSEESALTEVDLSDADAFARAVNAATDRVVGLIREIENPGDGQALSERLMDLTGSPLGPELLDAVGVATPSRPGSPEVSRDPGGQGEDGPVGDQMDKLIDTALVEYLGRDATPPRDLLVWALDRDPLSPAIPALEVRVLLTKAQLSDLVVKLGLVTRALKQAELTQMAFFDALSGVAAGTVKNPDQIRGSDQLKGAGLLDAFIESLPYRSQILSLSNELFATMTPTERADLNNGLEAKLTLYRAVNDDVDGWIKLNPSDPDVDKVYPLHLDALP